MTEEIIRRETLLAAAQSGNFLEAVYKCSLAERDERENVAVDLAALHNDGLVDVVAEFEKLSNKSPGGPDFFLTRHVFEKALPHINASVSAVMRCVLRLHKAAGQDMAAGTIFEGYIGYSSKDPARAVEALKEIEARPDELVDMLPATIAAGSQVDNPCFLAEVIRLSRHPHMALRQRAVFSMSRVQWPKGEPVPDSALTAVEYSAATETDDEILASVVKSAFALFQQDTAREAQVTALIGSALAKGDTNTLHAASTLFGFYTKDLPSPLLDLLLDYLKQVKPENRGTLDNIDYGIAHLLRSGNAEKGLRFLEELLVTHAGKVSIKTLDSVGAEIRQKNVLISKIATRWFLRGESILCESVHDICGTHHGEDLVIEIDVAELSPADLVHIIFIARKAIGYFFVKPITAASIVIGLMRHAPDDETLNELGQLLFDPLLLNYPGTMREYVQTQAKSESDKVKEVVGRALASIDEYLETLRSVPVLPALRPSQSHRESYRRYMSESTAASMKAAEKNSVFFGLFARSTLLYGRKSINYIDPGNGQQPQRMEMPLTSHSVEMDIPRMDNLDEYGLNFMLRVFRVERLRT